MRVISIAPGLSEIRVVVRNSTLDGLTRARDLMSHSNPSGDMDVVLDRLARMGVAQLEKRKFAKTDNPRPTRSGASDSRHIPADVQRAVYARDGGRCAFIDARGRRCGATHQLEYDHIVPVAQGGRSTVENLRMLCRAHNHHLAAINVFGLAFMGQKIEEAKAGREPEPSRALVPSGFMSRTGGPGSTG